MERLAQRITLAQQTLSTFNEVLQMSVNPVVRDATLHRFEFAVEAVWKLCQLYLHEKEGLEVNTPKSALRGCFQVRLLDEDQTRIALKMVDDRNLTVHTYNEALAEKIYAQMPIYYDIMQIVVTGITQHL